MDDNRANTFLRMIRHAQRGRLKVYLGYCPGVGKTYQMLQEGHRLKYDGIDVVVGLVESHGRTDIIKLVEGLEVIPRRRQEYRGVPVEEMDVDAILARKPQVALIDELAHTNVPGSLNQKRYQDVQDVLAAGIHVITTLNVQHLESLYNLVEKAVGVKVRERLPDSVLAEADQIVDVDLSTEDLQKRLEEGKIYPFERIQTALSNFFRTSNLEKLRELTLRELASQIDLRRREDEEKGTDATPDQLMVCLSSRGPNSDKLLRYASRLAGKMNRNWYAVYVQTPSEEATVIDAHTQRLLADTLTLAKQLGAMVFTYKGEDIVDTILRFAREYRVDHVIIGRPGPKSFFKKKFGKNKDIIGNLIEKALGINIVVMDTREEESFTTPDRKEVRTVSPAATAASKSNLPSQESLRLHQLLSPERILIWDQPVPKESILQKLVEAAVKSGRLEGQETILNRHAPPGRDTTKDENRDRLGQASNPIFVLEEVLKREEQGSTFFNEGAAFPHARIGGLARPIVALGLTRKGVSDVLAEKSIEIIFLILSPAESPDLQVKILGLASRAVQNRILRQTIGSAQTSEEVLAFISDWENQ
jgi:two-component system, OmpR family, sensor histidine kinase KdpD